MGKGWIALHRDIEDHWIYQEKRTFSKFEAWTSILMRVNHKDGKVMHNGTLEEVKRGSTIWSIGGMEESWGWSNKKVKGFLNRLKLDGMLSYKCTTKKTYLTVDNYDKYQFGEEPNAPPMHHQVTTDAPPMHTNNNDNNVNKENNLSSSSKSNAEKFGEAYRYIQKIRLSINLKQEQALQDYIDKGMEPKLVERAVDMTLEKGKDFAYMWGILNNCSDSGINTILEFDRKNDKWEEEKRDAELKKRNQRTGSRGDQTKSDSLPVQYAYLDRTGWKNKDKYKDVPVSDVL